MEHLLSVADTGLIITFFSCGQSMFMQCYTVALHKRLISATVHVGMFDSRLQIICLTCGLRPSHTGQHCVIIGNILYLISTNICNEENKHVCGW